MSVIVIVIIRRSDGSPLIVRKDRMTPDRLSIQSEHSDRHSIHSQRFAEDEQLIVN